MALNPDYLPASLIMDTYSIDGIEVDVNEIDEDEDDTWWDDGDTWPDATGILYKQIPDWDRTNAYWRDNNHKILMEIKTWDT